MHTKKLLFLFSLVVVCFAPVLLLSNDNIGEDINGNLPEDVLTDFFELSRIGNYEKASGLWTKESISRIEQNHYIGSLKNLSAELAAKDYIFDDATFGKYTTIVMIIAVAENENEGKRKIFYFEVRDSQWKLHWPKPQHIREEKQVTSNFN